MNWNKVLMVLSLVTGTAGAVGVAYASYTIAIPLVLGKNGPPYVANSDFRKFRIQTVQSLSGVEYRSMQDHRSIVESKIRDDNAEVQQLQETLRKQPNNAIYQRMLSDAEQTLKDDEADRDTTRSVISHFKF